MHEPEKWGYLQFTHSTTTEDIVCKSGKDELTAQVAYALFRKTRFGSLKDLLTLTAGSEQELLITYEKDKTLYANFTKTHFGFEITLHSPFSKTSYVINQDGFLKEL